MALDATDVCGTNVGVDAVAPHQAFQSIVKTTSVYVTRAHLSTGSQNIVGGDGDGGGGGGAASKRKREKGLSKTGG